MNDNNDNIVEFPTQDRKKEVERERTNKTKPSFGSFATSNYTIKDVSYDGWEKWIPQSFDVSDTISFENISGIQWTPSVLGHNQSMLEQIIDRCASIHKRSIELGNTGDTLVLQHVLDKLDEALLLSKISLK